MQTGIAEAAAALMRTTAMTTGVNRRSAPAIETTMPEILAAGQEMIHELPTQTSIPAIATMTLAGRNVMIASAALSRATCSREISISRVDSSERSSATAIVSTPSSIGIAHARLNITDEKLRTAMTGVWERRRQLKAVGQSG